MLINVPIRVRKEYIGELYKDIGYSYYLSDIKENNINNALKMSSLDYSSHIYNINDTYLFVVGNTVKISKIDILAKVLKFEQMLHLKNRKINIVKTPNKICKLLSYKSYLYDDLTGVNLDLDEILLEKQNSYLQAYKLPKNKLLYFLADKGIGIETCYCSFITYYSDKIYVLKDKDIKGHIIKYDTLSDFK